MNDERSLDEMKDLSLNSKKPLFTIKKWTFVAFWDWTVNSDVCAICRVLVADACLTCQSANKDDECVIVWGQCNHAFHNCCIVKWIQQSNRCPLCQQGWKNCDNDRVK